MDNFTRKEMREYAWKYFESHVDQRLRLFNFFITIVTFASGGFLGLIKLSVSIEKWMSLVPFSLIFICFIFWKLEERSRMLTKNGEKALKYLDSTLNLMNDDNNQPHPLMLFDSDDYEVSKKNLYPILSGHFSYSRCFRWVYLVFATIGLIVGFICLII